MLLYIKKTMETSKKIKMENYIFFILTRYAVFLIVVILLSGCSRPYKEYAEAHQQSIKSEADARSIAFTTAFRAVQELCKVFDQAVVTQASKKVPIVTKEGVDINGNAQTDTIYLPAQDIGVSILLAGVAKSMIIREVHPLIKEITREMTNKLERPVTVEEVLLKVADETGLIAVIGGMYGLGKAGIENAGTALSNITLENGSSIGIENAGATVGANSPWIDNHNEDSSLPEELSLEGESIE
ncbi:hypothetical protein KKHLCK_00100 [Candidatus Electrothrix laxa]